MILALAIPVFPLLLLAQPVSEAVLRDWCEDRKAAKDVHAVRLCADWSSAAGADRASWTDAVATLMRRGRMMSGTESPPAPRTPTAEPRPDETPAPPETPRAATLPASAAAGPATEPPTPTPIALPDTPLGRCLAEVPPGSWTSCGTAPIPLVKDGIRGMTGPRSVIRAWNGAAFDAATETMYFTGGGHADYGGSEIYAFDAPRLAWRLEKPHTGNLILLESGPAGRCEFRYDDGTPSARHTYDGILFFDGKIVVAGGSFFCPHGPSRNEGSVYTYDPGTGAYDFPMDSRLVEDGALIRSGYDRGRSILILSNTNRLLTVRDWKILDRRQGLNSWGAVATFLDWRRLYLLIDSLGLRAFPISPEGSIGAPVRLLPPPEVDAFRDAGLAEIGDGSLAIWPGGATLYRLDTETWTIRQYGDPQGRGPTDFRRVYSKFAYLPAHRALMGYNDETRPVWFYRLEADGTMPFGKPARISPDRECDDRIHAAACPDLQGLLAFGR